MPDAVALRHRGESATFGELERKSEMLANALAARGLGRGSYVGVHLERSVDYVVCLLGVLKANAAAVPLPPSYPGERLQQILAFADLDLVIDSAGTRIAPSVGTKASCLNDLLVEKAPRASSDRGDPHQPAFVLCSSGSTGTPKMIVRSHDSFFHRLEWTWREHPFTEADVGCQKAHMTTTHSLYELFEPLLAGAPVLLIGDQQARNLEEFWQAVHEQGITRLLLVPSALRASLDMPAFSPPALRTLVLMGEYLQADLAERALSVFRSDTSIYSIYGSTEASSALVCDLRRHFRAGEDLPLGDPISDDVKVQVRAPDRSAATPGERGRLYIGGRALFSEYFRDPELTSSVFTEMPDQEGNFYDTRDDVCQQPNGEIYFVARTDDTVKVRGFRVDLQEVESAVRSHDSVRDVAVAVTGRGGGNARLIGFYAPASVPAAEIYDAVRSRLPEYMVPNALVGVDAFPRTASGKVDRLSLLAEHGPGAVTETRARTLSETERRVATAWASILEHAQFGPETSFFEAGGTSLTAFSLIHRLRADFGLDRDHLGEQSLYQFPTLEGLSDHLDAILSGREAAGGIQIPLLVTLRQAADPSREPVFLISSAGGTLGAYSKLVKALDTDREVIGVRDPFLWGARDPTAGFDHWVGLYLNALRERQPQGPYFIAGYSSAGAFAYELACQLRESGEDVSLLALIDPLGIASGGRSEFGWWVLNAMSAGMYVRLGTRIAGRLRGAVPPLLRRYLHKHTGYEWRITQEEFDEHVRQTRSDKGFMFFLSSLFELNTGLPFALSEGDFAHVDSDEYLGVFKERVAQVIREFDIDQLERIAFQYHLQARAQHAYHLRRFDGKVLVAEPRTPYAGLVAIQLRPFVSNLKSVVLPLGEPSGRVEEVSRCFAKWQLHFRSMRDDQFVGELAREIGAALRS